MYAERLTADELKERGTNTPASSEAVRLYRHAFAEFGGVALWSSRPVAHPTASDVLAMTESLRVEGNPAARRLAERIEELRRAVL